MVDNPTSDPDDPTPVAGMQTRVQNKTRQPGKQIGLNWQVQLAEQEEATAKKAEKKASIEKKKCKRADIIACQNCRVCRITEIELTCEREDIEDTEYLEASTAHGYCKTSRALGSQPQSGSDHNQQHSDASEEDSGDEDDHAVQGSRKVRHNSRHAMCCSYRPSAFRSR